MTERLTPIEAAKALKISRAQIFRLKAQGLLLGIEKTGKRQWRVKADELGIKEETKPEPRQYMRAAGLRRN